jgi:hypothetical protein
MKRHVLMYGLIGGILIALLRWTEYQFLVVEHSIEIYGGLIAATFAVLGIWLGLKLPIPAVFSTNSGRDEELKRCNSARNSAFSPDLLAHEHGSRQ